MQAKDGDEDEEALEREDNRLVELEGILDKYDPEIVQQRNLVC